MVACVFSSCQKKSTDNIVARINNFEITFDDLVKQFNEKNYTDFSKADDETKRKVLDDMIDQQITLFEAYRLDYDKDPEFTKFIKEKERELAADVLRKQEIEDKVLNNKLLMQYYEWLDKKVKVLRIKFKVDRNEKNKEEKRLKAVDVYNKILDGADIKELAFLFSEHKRAKIDSGKMNMSNCFEMDEKLFNKAYQMKVGEVSQPFYANYAYYIIQVEKIEPQSKGTFEEEKERITKELSSIYEQEFFKQSNKLYNQVRDVFHYRTFADNIDFFCNRCRNIIIKADSMNLFNDKERTLLLTKNDTEEVTIGLFFDTAFEYYWSSLYKKRLVNTLLSDLNMNRMTKTLAMQKGINKLPQVQDDLKKWRVYLLKKITVEKEVDDKIDVSDSMLRPIYEKKRNNLIFEKEVTVREIFCITRDEIDKVHRMALNGYDFKELAIKYSQDKENRRKGIKGPFPKGLNGTLGETAFRMKIGEISEPFQYHGGYSFIKLLAIDPERPKSFQEASDKLEKEYIKDNKDEYQKEWLQRAKKRYNITIYI